MIKRFIVWYLKRHNVKFEYENYVVRMFSRDYYDKLMLYADMPSDTGCKYCKTSEDGTCKVVNFENPSNSSENYDIQFVFNSIDISKKFGDDVVATFSTPIKYCPFCGRKLFIVDTINI